MSNNPDLGNQPPQAPSLYNETNRRRSYPSRASQQSGFLSRPLPPSETEDSGGMLRVATTATVSQPETGYLPYYRLPLPGEALGSRAMLPYSATLAQRNAELLDYGIPGGRGVIGAPPGVIDLGHHPGMLPPYSAYLQSGGIRPETGAMLRQHSFPLGYPGAISPAVPSPETPPRSRSFYPVAGDSDIPTFFSPGRDVCLSPNQQIDQHQSPWDLKRPSSALLESPSESPIYSRRRSTGAASHYAIAETPPVHYSDRSRRRASYMSDPGKHDFDWAVESGYMNEEATPSESPQKLDFNVSRPRKKRMVDNSPFPVKLHAILSDPQYHDCMVWLAHGKAWKIVNPQELEQRVLSKFFRSSRYASFMRQVSLSKWPK